MGRAKDQWLEEQERGWSGNDTYVCDECVEDVYLKTVIQQNATCDTCDYCGRHSDEDIAAPFDNLMEVIASAVYYRFNDPTEAGVPWDEGTPVVILIRLRNRQLGTDPVKAHPSGLNFR